MLFQTRDGHFWQFLILTIIMFQKRFIKFSGVTVRTLLDYDYDAAMLLKKKHLKKNCCLRWNWLPLRELELRRKRYGECHQRCPALNHMCNQSKLTARRQVRVTSWPGCLKARDVQPASAFCHSAKLSMCVSHVYVLWVSYYRLSKKDRK